MIYSIFTMILLTFGVAAYLLTLRVQAVSAGQLKMSDLRLNSSETPANITQAVRNYSNLFEVPTLFYVAGAIAIALNLESTMMIVFSWIFVAARIAHSWIHLTYNNVIHRLIAFMTGNVCVLIIWAQVVWGYSSFIR